jgi:hypothetical protein
MTKIRLFLIFLFLISLSKSGYASVEISPAKVSELSLHRIDRLATLKKIDPSFLSAIKSLELAIIENSMPLKFSITITQESSINLPLSINLGFDLEGKSLFYKVSENGTANSNFFWGNKTRNIFFENSLHYILDFYLENTDLKKYFDFFSRAEIFEDSANDNKTARVRISNSKDSEVLNIILDADAIVISYHLSNAPDLFTVVDKEILQPKCIQCHGINGSAKRIPLTKDFLLNSPLELVVPGNTEESGLYIALIRNDERRMPPPDTAEALTPAQIDLISQWINSIK